MAKVGTRPTRVASDLVDAAEMTSADQSRSPAEQISQWARVGMELERADTLDQRRLAEVADGREQFSNLAGHDRKHVHALVDAQIMDAAATQEFGPVARTGGASSVSLDDQGRLVQTAPDGTRTYL